MDFKYVFFKLSFIIFFLGSFKEVNHSQEGNSDSVATVSWIKYMMTEKNTSEVAPLRLSRGD